MKTRKNGILQLLILGFMISAIGSTTVNAETETERAAHDNAGHGHKNKAKAARKALKKAAKKVAKKAKKAASNPTQELLKEMVSEDDYKTFVEKLGKNISDPKFKAALEAGGEGDKTKFDLKAAFVVGQLVPTQNEIDANKSLVYPLTKTDAPTLRKYLAATLDSTDTFAPGGVIISAGARYVIDGHHRWSQLYLMNPKIKIQAIDMEIYDPVGALKDTQLAIASVTGKIPVEEVKGLNLLTMSHDDFVKWMHDLKIPDATLAVFKEFGIDGVDAITEYVWKNAEAMRVHNAPIKGASPRNLMPQTGTADGWVKALEDGKINRN